MSSYFQFPFQKWTEIFPAEPNQRLQIFYGGREPNDDAAHELFNRNSANLDKFISDQRSRYNLSSVNYQGGQAQFPEFTAKYTNNYGQERIHIDPIIGRLGLPGEKEEKTHKDIMKDGYIAVVVQAAYDNDVFNNYTSTTPGHKYPDHTNDTTGTTDICAFGYGGSATFTPDGPVQVGIWANCGPAQNDGLIHWTGGDFFIGGVYVNSGGKVGYQPPDKDPSTSGPDKPPTIEPSPIDNIKIKLNGAELVSYSPEKLTTTTLLFRFGDNACKCPSYRDDLNELFKDDLLGRCIPPRPYTAEETDNCPEEHQLRERLPAYPWCDETFWHGHMQTIFEGNVIPIELEDMGVFDIDLILEGENIVEISGSKEETDDISISRCYVTAYAEFFSRDPTTFRDVYSSWRFNSEGDIGKKGKGNITVNDKPLYFFAGAEKDNKQSAHDQAADARNTIQGDDFVLDPEKNELEGRFLRAGIVDVTEYTDVEDAYCFAMTKVDNEDKIFTFRFDLSTDNPPETVQPPDVTNDGLQNEGDEPHGNTGPLVVLKEEPELRKNSSYEPHITHLANENFLSEQENGITDWLLFVRSLLPYFWPTGSDVPLTDQEEEKWVK